MGAGLSFTADLCTRKKPRPLTPPNGRLMSGPLAKKAREEARCAADLQCLGKYIFEATLNCKPQVERLAMNNFEWIDRWYAAWAAAIQLGNFWKNSRPRRSFPSKKVSPAGRLWLPQLQPEWARTLSCSICNRGWSWKKWLRGACFHLAFF